MIREVVVQLGERPDGQHAWACWDLLMQFYLAQTEGGDPLTKFELISHMVAAGGKMVAFWPPDEPQDPQKLLWYAQSLVNMNLDPLARPHLQRAQTLPISDPGLRTAIAETLRGLSDDAGSRQTVGPVGSRRPTISPVRSQRSPARPGPRVRSAAADDPLRSPRPRASRGAPARGRMPDEVIVPVPRPAHSVERSDPYFVRRPSAHPLARRYFADRETYDTACMVDGAPMTIVEGSQFTMSEFEKLQGGFRCGNCGRVTCWEHANGDMRCECGAVNWRQCSYIYPMTAGRPG
jgi:hypothetical protein